MHVQAFGIFCLGMFIGYLGWYFVVRIGRGQVGVDSFASVMAVLVGGAVISFFDEYLTPKSDVWWYPIGLVAGFVLYLVASAFNSRTPGGETPPVGGGSGPIFPTAAGLFKHK